jgi:PAS domain S-box-containing protein
MAASTFMSGQVPSDDAERTGARSASAPESPSVLTFLLIAYALLLCVIAWSYAALSIRTDLERTLDAERSRLRDVTLTIGGQIEAMLHDGVGAALAAANELGALEPRTGASDALVSQTLTHMLTGGDYVRSLFLAAPDRFVRVGRSGTQTATAAPSWLAPALSLRSQDTWVGAPMADPENRAVQVIPIAQRVGGERGSATWAGALFAFGLMDRLYRQFEPESGIAILRSDGTALLLRVTGEAYPYEGGSIADSELFRRASEGPESGVLEGPGPYRPIAIIAAYVRLHGFPIMAAASRPRSVALAAWLGRRRATLWLTAISSLVLVAMTGLIGYFVSALRRRDRHYSTLFNNAAFSAFVLEGERFKEANRTTARMFGVEDARALRGKTPWDVSPALQPDGKPSEERAREQINRALAVGSNSFEWMHKRLDTDEPFPAEVDLSSLQAGGKTLTLAVVHDVTERQHADRERERALRELHELAGTLVGLQDEERRRIGRDLHDTTGQALAALEFKLERLAQRAEPLGDVQRALVHECLELAHQCSREIRTASYLLHPPLLEEIGLLSALRWLADGLRQRSEIDVRLELPQTTARLPREQELAIFRVAQEALTNVHRHSRSPSATLRLYEQDGAMVLEVEDVGQGMAAGSASGLVEEASALGVGLAGMRERMRQLGGILTVSSGPQGTCVRASLPIIRAESPPTKAATLLAR